MTDYIRRLVSGNKARFKDHTLHVELDLVYVTDQVVIMGYPASGIEGLYRNRREDARKFLEHRHGKNYWVFNFCPIKENSYEANVFEGRVSRYPFPDHHAPPLAAMPLVAREMQDWLSGSPERVAVLHCKAGKGRSGTMACTYLLSLGDIPLPPQLERSHNAREWAKRRTESTIDALPAEEDAVPVAKKTLPSFVEKSAASDADGILDIDTGSAPPLSASPNPEKSFTDTLKGVLDLHTAQRMKQIPEKEGKVKQGVSIPSQRRFLYYWALLLAHEAPKHMWTNGPRPKVHLTQLTLRMRETSSFRMGIVKAANKVMERTNKVKGPTGGAATEGSSSQVWASLARYDDGLVNLLEEWEAYTRDSEGNMGKRRPGSDHRASSDGSQDAHLSQIFEDGKWDKGKMVRSFARLGLVNNAQEKVVDDNEEKIHVYTLAPLSDERWEGLKHDLHKTTHHDHPQRKQTLDAIDSQANAVGVSHSEANSIMNDVTTAVEVKPDTLPDVNISEGILLDAGREVRVKLYVGQVFIGWLWFIPTFHMPQPPPTASPDSATPTTQSTTSSTKTTFTLTRKDVDFPLGLGSSIIDVDIEMEWVRPTSGSGAQTSVEPPVCAHTGDLKTGVDVDPEGNSAVSAILQAVVAGADGTDNVLGRVGLREVVEARQGGEE